MTAESLQVLQSQLAETGVRLSLTPEAEQRLAKLRSMYEPYVAALAEYLLITLPPWVRAPEARDNWRTSRWGGRYTI